MDRAGLEEILKQELSGKKDSAGRGEWTLDHCRRTARLAVALRVAAGENPVLDDLLFAAGLFHDVAHDSVSHALHGAAGALRARELLGPVLEPEFLARVAAIIEAHDDRRPDDGRGAAAHLVQDADLLDHFGAARVWAEFGYAAKQGLRFEESLERIRIWQGDSDRYLALLHCEASRRELAFRLKEEARFLESAFPQALGKLISRPSPAGENRCSPPCFHQVQEGTVPSV